MIASSLHSILANHDNSLCVSQEGKLVFFILRLLTSFSFPLHNQVLAELCQCLHCILGLNVPTTHKVRKSNSIANMFALDAKCLYNLSLQISNHPVLKEHAKRLDGILLEWGDLESRRQGRGITNREGIQAGVYDAQLMEEVEKMMTMKHTVGLNEWL